MQGLRKELQDASDLLADKIADVPVRSVCDLFLAEIAKEMRMGEVHN